VSKINPKLAKFTLTKIELHSYGNATSPCYRDDSHIAGAHYRVLLMFKDCIPVRVSLKDLSEKRTL